MQIIQKWPLFFFLKLPTAYEFFGIQQLLSRQPDIIALTECGVRKYLSKLTRQRGKAPQVDATVVSTHSVQLCAVSRSYLYLICFITGNFSLFSREATVSCLHVVHPTASTPITTTTHVFASSRSLFASQSLVHISFASGRRELLSVERDQLFSAKLRLAEPCSYY